MEPVNVKMGFVLASHSSDPLPSTRISVLHMFPYLREAGIEPVIVYEPESTSATAHPVLPDLTERVRAQGIGVVYFQKVLGNSAGEQMRKLSAAGVRIVLGLCDYVDPELAEVADSVIVVTDYLRSLFPAAQHHKIAVVHDGLENDQVHKDDYGSRRGSPAEPLRAVLVTSHDLYHLPVLGAPPDWLEISIVGRYAPADARLDRMREVKRALEACGGAGAAARILSFVFNRRIRRVGWTPDGVYDEMLRADIGIIPIDRTPAHEAGAMPPPWKVKSQNRLTMKMAVGLPVIATPIPSYLPVVEQGANAFLAETPADWAAFLDQLRDPAERERIGRAARAHVIETNSQQRQAQELIAVLQGLA